MTRRRGRRFERVALVAALVTAAACAGILLFTDGDESVGSDDGAPATSSTVVTAPRPPSTTVELPPGCRALADIREAQDASRRLQDLLENVSLEPSDQLALVATIDALDVYTEDQLPVIAAALGELATDLPDRAEDARLLRRFVVEVVRALDASESSEAIAAVLTEAFDREDANRALAAVAGFVAYDYEVCPQPLG